MGKPTGFMDIEKLDRGYKPVSERISNYKEFVVPLTKEETINQAARCMDCGVPFCHDRCPVNNIIPDWNDLVYRNDWRAALEVLHSTNNFPEFTGRICPAPCEAACTLNLYEEPVSIKTIECAIIDKGFEEGWIEPKIARNKTGKKVSVIGAGPAGLACAQQLTRAGHDVTVYEKNNKAGGLLRYGIPDFKMEKHIIDRRINQLEEEGTIFKYGVNIGVDITIEDLENNYDAIVLSGGSEHPRDLPVEGRDLDGIHFAMEFLPQQNRANWGDSNIAALHPKKQAISAKGKKVIVIGGGDTGSDCIGTSMRQGATSVVNFELLDQPPEERAENNPWPQWSRIMRVSTSVEEMRVMGGDVFYEIMTTRFIGREKSVSALETVRVEWVDGRPQPIAGSEQIWKCDLVLLAMGYLGPRTELLKQIGCDTDLRSNIKTDPKTHMSSVDGVFAAGDCRRGQSLVVWAISEGREIARCVDEYLTGTGSQLPEVRLEPFAY